MTTHALRTHAIACLGVFFLPTTQTFAQTVIDFETVPGIGTPAETQPIGSQYEPTLGVTFALVSGGEPVIAEVSAPLIAFQGPGGGSDTPAGGQGVGSFFLTDDTVLTTTAAPLKLTFTTPVIFVGGDILDIDFSEAWTIEAYDGSFMLLDSVVLVAGDPGTGDGIATPWLITRSIDEIAHIHRNDRTSGKCGRPRV